MLDAVSDGHGVYAASHKLILRAAQGEGFGLGREMSGLPPLVTGEAAVSCASVLALLSAVFCTMDGQEVAAWMSTPPPPPRAVRCGG